MSPPSPQSPGRPVQPTARPARYHRRTGLWSIALARLARLGWSDAEIAATLSDLSPLAIRRLEAGGTWNQDTVEAEAVPEAGTPWTPRAVRYHRRAMSLPANRLDRTLTEDRRRLANSLAAQLGWGHLVDRATTLADLLCEGLPTEDKVGAASSASAAGALGDDWTPARVRAWLHCPWDTLWPASVFVLSALWDAARPLTLVQLQERVDRLAVEKKLADPAGTPGGRPPPRLVCCWPHTRLGWLVSAGLVETGPPARTGRRGSPSHTYQLAPGLLPHGCADVPEHGSEEGENG